MKKVLGVIIIVILIFAVIWLVYENTKAEPANINAMNETQNENMGMSNVIEDLYGEDSTNTVNEPQEEINDEVETEEPQVENKENNTEIVSGTTASREERAIEIAKEYYEQEYGDADSTLFGYESVYGDGRYIIRVGTAGSSMNLWLLVNLETGEVTEW